MVLSVVTPCFTFRRGKGSLAPKVAKHPPNLQLDLDLGCTYTEPRIIYRIRQHFSVEPKCFFAASLFAIRAFKQLSISWDWRQPAATGGNQPFGI